MHCILLCSPAPLSTLRPIRIAFCFLPLTLAQELLPLNMMEAAEDASLEAAIQWLVQTILGSLLIDKLDAWIQGAGFADDIERLKSEVERVEMVVAAVNGRALGNKPLARSLARLKELVYDVDDVVDELDYWRIQQQIEGVTLDESEAAEQVDERSSISGDKKRRSDAWDHFETPVVENGKPVRAKCKYCPQVILCGSRNGTSGMRTHTKKCKNKPGPDDQPPNHSSTVDSIIIATPVVSDNSSSRKRRRAGQEAVQSTAANTHIPSWNKAELSNRIQEITRQLQDIRGDVRGFLTMLGSDSGASLNHCRSKTWTRCLDQPLRTSSVVQRKLYGRAEEKESIIIKLVTEHKSGGLNILPIVGIGGVGKTALAQHIYNDPAVENQFHHRIWVWVSDIFDEMSLTMEMLDFVSGERHYGYPKKKGRHEGISSFAKLQEILKEHMQYQSKRFLLVLDDVWDNLDNHRWNKLLAPFISSHVKGNAILVTTRSFSVAQRVGTLEPVKLGALENDDFLLLFKAHAFGDQNHEGHESLSIIGQQIAEKLNGNPLAAESAGELLRKKLETDHWSNILKNEEWKSLQLSTGIMPALKRSYDQLPYHLQQCFSCPSIFPDSYLFLAEELVHFWISQGFVKSSHSNLRLEEIALCYLTDLVNLGFFQQVEQGSQTCYAMHGLVHDFARMVSWSECAMIDGLQCNKMLLTIRHLSIVTDSAYSKDQHGNIPRNQDFEKNLRNRITSMKKLRTLVLIGQYDYSFFLLFQEICQQAQNLRLLQMSAMHADFCGALLCSSVNPAHLRYLKLDLSNMQKAIDVWVPSLEELSLRDMPKLERCSCTSVRGLDSSLWTLEIVNFHALKVFDLFENVRITYLTQLPVEDGENSQSNLISAPEAACSALISSAPNGLLGIPMNHISSLKEISIVCCPRLTFSLSKKGFSGFNSLEKLTIWECPKLLSSLVHKDENDDRANGRWLLPQSLGQLDISGDSPEILQPCFLENLTRLTKLSVSYNESLKSLRLQSCTALEDLEIYHCHSLVTLEGLQSLGSLTHLKLYNCPSLHPCLERLSVQGIELCPGDSPEILQPCFLENLTRLTKLSVSYNKSLKSLRLQSCTALEDLEIYHCHSLVTLEGLQSLGSLTHLKLYNCPSLHPCLERLSVQGIELCPQLPLLETLDIDYDSCLLTTSFCKHLSSLQYLRLSGWYSHTTQLTDDHEMALLLLASLQKLQFFRCGKLVDLPAGLKSLTSLKRLEIRWCNRISSLPEMGLPDSLEELDIYNCSQAFVRECIKLATSKLKVIIDWEKIN